MILRKPTASSLRLLFPELFADLVAMIDPPR
jgi:hypothetical protein